MPSVVVPDALQMLISEVDRTLRPAGWSCTVEAAATAVTVVLDHPLTVPYRLTLIPGNPRNRGFVERHLKRREFMVVAESPRSPTHGPLLRGIRETAFANRWPTDTVAVLARLLHAHELLTDEEAEWLELAGVPWNDDHQ